MKKLTAMILSVIMLVTAFPLTSFATGETVIMIDDAKDFAKMTDGRSYILTKNIELGSEWQTIQSFSGTFDGNGYTVTVPTNAPIFEVISGTVKNLNLAGTMTLTDDDVSKHYIGVKNIHYAVGVLANRAMGATVSNVHSDVNVTFNKLSDASKKGTVVFGGMIGAAYPSYKFDNEKDSIEGVRGTSIDNCTVAGKITAEYKALDEVHKIESVGGLVALATSNVDISNIEVTADITVNNVSGYVGGVFAVQYSSELPTLDGKETVNTPTISNISTAVRNATIENCLVSGSISRTADGGILGRIGGVAGYAQGLDMKACAYTGTKLEDKNGKERTVLAYGYTDGSSWCHITIDSCVATLGDKMMIYFYEYTQSFENVIVWGTYDKPVYNGNNDSGKKLVNSLEEALQTFVDANSSAFSYTQSTLSLKTVTKPSPNCTHECIVSDGNDQSLSTGKCTHENDSVNYITGDPYAGFVQFNNDGTKLRVIMIVSEDELGDSVNKKLKPLKTRITIENQSIEISGTEFTAYDSVTAEGKNYVASDGFYIFGAVFNFEVDMSSTAPSVAIIYEGETEPVFEGSVKKPNT